MSTSTDNSEYPPGKTESASSPVIALRSRLTRGFICGAATFCAGATFFSEHVGGISDLRALSIRLGTGLIFGIIGLVVGIVASRKTSMGCLGISLLIATSSLIGSVQGHRPAASYASSIPSIQSEETEAEDQKDARPSGERITLANGSCLLSPPEGWLPFELTGRMVWRVARQGGLADMSLIVTADDSFKSMSPDDYCSAVTQDAYQKMTEMIFDNVRIGLWEPRYSLAGHRALHVVLSADYEGATQVSAHVQTIHGGRLYTLGMNAPESEFPPLYLEFKRVVDSFSFSP